MAHCLHESVIKVYFCNNSACYFIEPAPMEQHLPGSYRVPKFHSKYLIIAMSFGGEFLLFTGCSISLAPALCWTLYKRQTHVQEQQLLLIQQNWIRPRTYIHVPARKNVWLSKSSEKCGWRLTPLSSGCDSNQNRGPCVPAFWLGGGICQLLHSCNFQHLL